MTCLVFKAMASRHAWVWISEAGLQVEDLGAGTLVNGYQITERCVASLDDLDAAEKAIHQKAVSERETSAQPSTLGAEIEGQIRLLNAQSGSSETEAPRP